MAKHMDGLELTTNLTTNQPLPLLKITQFEKLASMTHMSIRNEIEACHNEPEYSQVVAPWIPVKCYYRLYYLEAVLLYLLSSSNIGFTQGGHSGVRRELKRLLEANQLSFSISKISEPNTIGTVMAHRITSGSNLSYDFYDTDECVASVRKKVAEYIELDFKDKNRIMNYLSATNRAKKADFYAHTSINLTDFFYWMRIKANYKDVDYLDFDNDISADDAYKYVRQYAVAHESYAFALETLINRIKVSRRMNT